MKQYGGDAATTSHARALARLHELIISVPLSAELQEALDALTRGVVEVTGFGVASVAVVRPGAVAETLSIAGDPHLVELWSGRTALVRDLVHEDLPAEQWGMFRFVAHEDVEPDAGPAPRRLARKPDAWRPLDSLTAPLTGLEDELVGFLSVDQPPRGVRPDEQTLHYLDIFAVQVRTAICSHLERERLREQVRLAELGQHLLVAGTEAESTESLVSGFADAVRRDLGALRVGVRIGDSAAELTPGSWVSTGEGHPHVPAVPDELSDAMHAIARAGWRRQQAVTVTVGRPDPSHAAYVDRARLDAELVGRGVSTVLVAPVGAGGDFFGYVVHARDRTWPAWSEAETAFAWQAARDLGSSLLNRQLVAREREFTDHLRNVDENKRVLFSTIAHEFKGPIAAIAGHAELLEDGLDHETAMEDTALISVASIARNARRLNDMVEDLMVLQEVEEPGLPQAEEAVDLSAAVADAVDVWRLQAEIMDVRIVVDEPAEPVLAWGGTTAIGRVVINLISNAVKYSSYGGTIRVELENRGDRVLFRCSDEGIGISAADQAKLFDQFFRGSDVAVRRVAGTGLGLSIVRRIVEHLGGRIEVESDLGKGSTFVVELPAPPATGMSASSS